MIARTFSLYKNAYSGLSPATWWLSFVMLINRSGTMVVPFMTLYLTRPQMGYTIGQAGIVMALFGLGAVVGAYISGRLTDKMGFYPIQLITLCGGGILFIVLGQMKTYPLICIFAFLLSLVNEAFRPANSTAIAFYSKEENRTRSYSLNRLAINLGWAVGNAIGGFVAFYSYELLFWIDGITNIAAAILMWIFLRPVKVYKEEKKTEAGNSLYSAYKDTIYWWFILFTFLFASCFFQLFTSMPAYYRNELHFTEKFIGFVNSINGLMIAIIEMVLVFKLEGRYGNTVYITLGVFLCGIAYLLLSIFHVTHLMALLMIVIITFGEIFSMPFMNSFWISRSAYYNRGQYAALYTVAWSSAQTLGPLAGTQIAGRTGFTSLWWTMGILCIIASAGFGWLGKKLSMKEIR